MESSYKSYIKRYFVVLLLDSEEEYSSLIEKLSEYLLQKSRDAIAYHNRGLAYLEMGNEKGLKDIERSISIDGNRKEPYKVLGLFWERNLDLKQALAYFTKTIEADVNDAKNYRCRASVQEALGDLDSAISDLNKAIELEPTFEYTIKLRDKLQSRASS
ncbi:MAG: tetratricopeptide repeat protein [Calditrichia bacterium]